MCIVRQSGAGVSLGNTVRSARAIFKCPLVVTPCAVVGISSSPFCPTSPREPSLGQDSPCSAGPALSQAFSPGGLCSRTSACPRSRPCWGRASPEHLARFAAHVSLRPARARPAELPRLGMLGHCHSPVLLPSVCISVNLTENVRVGDLRVVQFPCAV